MYLGDFGSFMGRHRFSAVGVRRFQAVGVISALALGIVTGYYALGGSPAQPSSDMRAVMDAMVSVFEHDTTVIQYGYLDDRNDGRGFSAGRGSFSSAGGELLAVAEAYHQRSPDNPLEPYLDTLTTLATTRDRSHQGLEGFPKRG